MASTESSSLGLAQGPLKSDRPVVLILVGLVGSGKSTFATALQEHVAHFKRCNQDDLGNRRAVENLARKSLREGFSVCIDRTNFNPSQRAYWIDIAREFPDTPVWIIVFKTPYEVCASRLQERKSHPTLPDPELALSVLSRFASEYEAPSPHEGYDRIIELTPSDTTLNYTASDLNGILDRLRSAPDVPVPTNQQFFRTLAPGQYFRGGGSRSRGGSYWPSIGTRS